RQTSATGIPSRPCCRMNAFCASENLDAFIALRSSPASGKDPETLAKNDLFSGVRAKPKAGLPRVKAVPTRCANSGHNYLFDHLVGGGQKQRWDCQAKRSRRLKIDDELEFSWLYYR